MYNTNQKLRFIKSYTKSENTINLCVSIFNATGKNEAKLDKDLCQMTEEELVPIVEGLTGMRELSQSRVRILKEYGRWCLSEGISGATECIMRVKTSGLEKLEQRTVGGPEHLQRYLNQIYDSPDEETLDNMYRAYYWLAFAGLQEEDIPKVKITDVNLSLKVIVYKGKEYPVYDEAVNALKNCMLLKTFAYKNPNPNASASNIVRKGRIQGDTLVRGFSPISTMSMRSMVSRRTKRAVEKRKVDSRLSYYRVWISGLFFRTYEQEQLGIRPDFKNVAAARLGQKHYIGRVTPEARVRNAATDYETDYQRWKACYYPA